MGDPGTRFIIVGMHKAQVGNCTGSTRWQRTAMKACRGSRDLLELLAGKGDERPVDSS
ncbi:MAG: hypothetical protein ACRENE_35565 [Polyangiaceae bacterium]